MKKANEKPRTCIVTTKNVNAILLPQYSNGDTTTILVNTIQNGANEEILFSSIYMPYEELINVPHATAREIIQYSSDSGVPLVAGADCNAHHILWGCRNTNRRGELLAEFLVSTELEIANKGTEPTFINRARTEILDVTFVTQNFANRVTNWTVSAEETLSDHREINFSIDCDVNPLKLFRNPRNTNWSAFTKVLSLKMTKSNKYANINSTKKLNDAVNFLTKALQKAFLKSCPGRLNKPKGNDWWNNELQQLKLETRRLNRIAQASRDSPAEAASWLLLRRSRQKYTKEIRRAKAGDWTNFCSSIEGASATSRLHKLLAKDPTKGPGILKKQNGAFTSTKVEATQLLLDTHFPGNVSISNSVPTHIDKSVDQTFRAATPEHTAIDRILNKHRAEWAIHSFDKYKSPGYDNIYPAMLQKGWPLISGLVLDIYKASLLLNYIPDMWQRVRVIFIPKPGKEDYTSPKSFRPISLTSVLLKGLERLIDRHIKEEMNVTFQMQNSQHAFQQGKSTETALHELVSQIEDTLDKKEYLIATFMDIAGAFDNITFDAIQTHLYECGLDVNVCRWIKYMLTHRSITVESHGCEVTVTATRGTPQGGVLSPTLWILVMNSLLHNLQNGGFKAIGYADDLVIVCRGKYLSTLADRTQGAMKVIESWCTNVGLTVNPDKSDVVIFTRKRKLDGFKNPTIFGKMINKSDSVKYLGITLDAKLKWTNHIEQRINKCLRVFWCCRSAIGKTWGLTPQNINWMYGAIVKPMLAYGAFIWWHGTTTKTIQNKLNHLQRVACLAITGSMSTTPQAALESLLYLPKLEDYIMAEAKNTAYRLKHCITDAMYRSATHTNIVQKLLNHKRILDATSDRMQPKYIFERQFQVIVPDKSEWDNGNYTVEYRSNVFFTDGSVRKTGSGFGIFRAGQHTAKSGPCGNFATAKQTELAAINACCIYILQHEIEGPICIYSDSLAAITAIRSHKIESKLAFECVTMLESISERNVTKIIWIPSHSGIYGNDMADKAAKEAAQTINVCAEPLLAIDRMLVKKTISTWLEKKTCQNWQTTRGCEHTKGFIRKPEITITRQILNMPKKDTRLIIGTLTGHCKLNDHMTKLGMRDDPDCDLCGRTRETAKHILCECVMLSNIRNQILSKPALTQEQVSQCSMYKIIEFIKTCGNMYPHIKRIYG